MLNEALAVDMPGSLYLDLAFKLRQSGDLRTMDEVVTIAVKAWMATQLGGATGRGYQWKELFLPDGTDLRLHAFQRHYYAKVVGDEIMYAGEAMSPREWALTVTGSVRNAWRDIWIRRNVNEMWTLASTWRQQHRANPRLVCGDRRRHARRSTD